MAGMRINVSKEKRKHHSQEQAKQWNSRMGNHEYTHRRMIFGKYTNWFIKDLPLDYVKWAILNFTDKYWLDWLCRELCRRDPSFKYTTPTSKTKEHYGHVD
jgi:hypothetical protein